MLKALSARHRQLKDGIDLCGTIIDFSRAKKYKYRFIYIEKISYEIKFYLDTDRKGCEVFVPNIYRPFINKLLETTDCKEKL